jgi:DNA-binding LytR/AlgR family response regulator
MITCLAVDDEPLALQMAGKCSSALEALKFLQHQNVDLIFLDIQMPGLTGLQFIQSLSQKPMIILITAYEKFALQGFELDVVDYLVKPVSLDRFIKACNKALELHNLKTKQTDTKEPPPDYFFVNVDYSLQKVEFSDIQWIEGLKDYVKINLRSSSKPVITRMSMKTLEDQLPSSRFMRIHKSFIISIAAISSIRKNSVSIGQTELPVGDSYKDALNHLVNRGG